MIVKIVLDRIAHTTHVVRAYNDNDLLVKTFNIYEDMNRYALVSTVRQRCDEDVHNEVRIEYLKEQMLGE